MADILLVISILIKWFGEMVQEIGESIYSLAERMFIEKEKRRDG